MAGLLGTLRCAAPEQLAAAQIKVGPKADVRGLGVTLFELLTRHRLFEDAVDEKQLTSWVLTKPVPRLRAIDASLDPDLEAIVAVATELSQDDRLSARQLADLLDLYLSGKPLPIRLPGIAEMLRRWIRDHKGLAASVTAAAAAVVVATVTALVLINAAKNDAIAAENKATQLAEEKTKLAAREREARDETETQLYFSNIGLADSKWRAFRTDQTLGLLEECPPKLRDWEWYYLRRCCQAGFETNRVPGLTGERHCLALNPDGEMIAVAYEKVIRLCKSRRPPGQVMDLTGHNGNIVSLLFSRDGQHLASLAEVGGGDDKKSGEVKVWDVSDHKELFTVATRSASPGGGSLSFSSDGRMLVVSDLNQAHIYDLTGNRILTVPPRPLLVFSVALSPNRKALAVAGAKVGQAGYEGGVVHLWNLETGKNPQTLKVNTTIILHVLFNDDGKYLAVSGFDNAVSVWDVETGEELGRHADHTQRVIGMAFLDDLIVSAAEDRTLRVWQWKVGSRALATAGTTALRYPIAVETLVQAKDSGVLLAADAHGSVYIWKGDRQDYVQLQKHKRPVFCLSFNPDGSRLASRSFGGILKVWDTKTRKEIFALEGEDATTPCAAFSPDGRWLALNSDGDGKHDASELVVLDTQNGKVAFRVPTRRGKISHLAFHPDSHSLASVDPQAGTVTFWRFQGDGEKQLAQTVPGHAETITGVAFSPDGLFFATASLDAVKIWDARTGHELRRLQREDSVSFSDLAYSANGKLLACAIRRARR